MLRAGEHLLVAKNLELDDLDSRLTDSYMGNHFFRREHLCRRRPRASILDSRFHEKLYIPGN